MRLFAFGLGYCAARVIARGGFGGVAGTARTLAGVATWRGRGVDAFVFDGAHADEGIAAALMRSQIALLSIPPEADGDPALRAFADAMCGLRRIVYLSTVGVYGDSAGAWVDEASPLRAVTPRARARVAAEAAWRAFGAEAGVAVDVLRLGGIYGPGRGAFDRLRDGTGRRVVKLGQVFNRIHVDDIALAVETLVAAARPGDVYNVVDGSPSPPEDVVSYAAELLGLPPPPAEPFEAADLPEMARSFYEENRRVRNERLRRHGWAPVYPSYREGLRATLTQEGR